MTLSLEEDTTTGPSTNIITSCTHDNNNDWNYMLRHRKRRNRRNQEQQQQTNGKVNRLHYYYYDNRKKKCNHQHSQHNTTTSTSGSTAINKICMYMITSSICIFLLLNITTISSLQDTHYDNIHDDDIHYYDHHNYHHNHYYDSDLDGIVKVQIPYLLQNYDDNNNDNKNKNSNSRRRRHIIKPKGDISQKNIDDIINDNDTENHVDEDYYHDKENDDTHNVDDYSDDYITYVDDRLKTYFAFDDDTIRHEQCKRTSWHKNHHKPNCNMFHEVDYIDVDNPIYYLSSGEYRDAFRVSRHLLQDGNIDDDENDDQGRRGREEFVLKKGLQDRMYNDELIEMIRIDAMTMELLSPSKRILNLYGHCGTSVSVAKMNGTSLAKFITRRHSLSPEIKLYIALEMAKSIADLHGHKGGPIVHGDIHYLQWLFDENNNVVLVDFNRAEPLLWDEESENYCKYFTGGAMGNVRSPEEYAHNVIDEKIDVYSYGNVLYTMLTGKEPFQGEDFDNVGETLLAGNRPIIDADIRNSSDIEAMMSMVVDKCFEMDSEKRIDIFTVVAKLQDLFITKFGPYNNVTINDLGFEGAESFDDDDYYYYEEEKEVDEDMEEENMEEGYSAEEYYESDEESEMVDEKEEGDLAEEYYESDEESELVDTSAVHEELRT